MPSPSSHWIQNGIPALVLAPMEGVTDAPMRALLTELGGFTHCVSEFLRISQEVPPAKVYFSHVPELKFGCQTPSGTPIHYQLLGGDAEKLATAARLACQLGAVGIDLNFGCPAPTVNRHDGGATLLKSPGRIQSIVRAVRDAVPPAIPVSAKMRLGWDDIDTIDTTARMAEEGGANWITIHGRTRVQGYCPPAYWGPIGRVKKALSIPVVANGEIWTLEDFKRCREETEAEHFMIGRGALADPRLAPQIAAILGIELRPGHCPVPLNNRADWLRLVQKFSGYNVKWGKPNRNSGHIASRIKQWLKFSHLKQGIDWFEEIKAAQTLEDLYSRIAPQSL